MFKEDYRIIREKVRPLQMLGNISEEDVEIITNMYLEADRKHSLGLLFRALQATFQKDLDAESKEVFK